MSASLRDLQSGFLRALTTHDEGLSPEVSPTGFDGLSIYAHAYVARLVGCLSESFPAVARTIGEEAFGALAVDYLTAFPPASPNLADLGERFPAHLEATRPADLSEAGGFLVALAAYERALDEVFDGPGGEGGGELSPQTLAELSGAAWARARLVPTPALRLLELGFPVDDYWATVRRLEEGESPPPLPAASPQFLALSRRDYVVRRLRLEPSEFALLQALVSGQTVGDAVVNLSDRLDEGGLRRWFDRWMTEGLFVALEAC